MIKVGDFKNGTVFEDGNAIFTVLWFQHHKPGKGGAVVRLKIKNLSSGTTVEKTMKPEVKFREIEVSRRNVSYLYKDSSGFHFMDQETYEQSQLSAEAMADVEKYLKENMEVIAVSIDNKFTSIEMPINGVYEIKHTEPGVKGNTAQGAKKAATLETGAEIQVPLFINEGDKVKVNTTTGEYVERAS
jgi:elongation factor P